ncbi:MAG TPA: hypothetical protein VNA25_15275 [Phycisphaerae bacterium]|nr:hypothetical protein [Phycisphaerae bacterium]
MSTKLAFPLTLAAILVAGCTQLDENVEWNPKADYPPWAYDAPFYYRPSEELPIGEVIGPGIPVYYSSYRDVLVKHPAGTQPTGEPRVAVWCSTDMGQTWGRLGYYGVEQTHFVFRAEQDGPHWIRFVGPRLLSADAPPAMPHRVYVVDTAPPDIVVTVDPPPWEDKDKKVPRTYKVGEDVMVSWFVNDPYLDEESIALSSCFAEFPHNLVWGRLPRKLAPSGCEKIMIPPEAAANGGVRFRIEAADKSGNAEIALTDVLHVSGSLPATTQPTVQPTGLEVATTQAVTPLGDKPGWPLAGTMLRGGTKQVLRWMPELASKYDKLELEFSANDGRTWLTVVTGIKAGESVNWTVPSITSRMCRLRLVGADANGQKVMIVLSRKFKVDTVLPDTIMGPKPIVQDR